LAKRGKTQMLAFTRRPNESFLIGEEFVVKVLGRDDQGNIKFGIEVPEPASLEAKESLTKVKTAGSG